MKKFALRLAFVLTVMTFLKLLIFEQNVSIMKLLAVSLVTGIITFVFTQIFLLPVRKSLDNIISDITGKHADLIAYAPTNHVEKYFIKSKGGIGCLYKDRLLFIPHKLNFSREEVSISFSEVENIMGYKICGIFGTGLKITMKSGKIEKFVVDKTTLFYKKMLDMIRE